MAEINHFAYGPITPILAYALSVLGSLLGLTCTVKARGADSAGRRSWWLLLAAWAIGGTGIWVMHFMAMLGFGVSGSEIRYDVGLTAASAVLAIGVVAVGLFIVGFGRAHPVKIVIGGILTGLGVAGMHYVGMQAMHLDGTIRYDRLLVALSITIAVVAATTALWFTVTVRRLPAIIGSAMVMGVAVCGMHYTGMYAMEVHLHGTGDPQTGAPVFSLILPILLLVLLVIVALIAALLAAPTEPDQPGGAGSGTGGSGTGGGTGGSRTGEADPSAAIAPVSAPPNRHSVSLAEASGRRSPAQSGPGRPGRALPSLGQPASGQPGSGQPGSGQPGSGHTDSGQLGSGQAGPDIRRQSLPRRRPGDGVSRSG